ncbi:hypothetical protein V3N99_17705 [Dermatophilaceae bacterium Soc4.6]
MAGLAVVPSASAATNPGSLGKGLPALTAPAPPATAKTPSTVHALVTAYTKVSSASFTDAAGQESFASVACPPGTKVIGGGAVVAGSSLSESINSSAPAVDGKSWRVWVNNAGSTNGTFVVFANCAAGIVLYTVVPGAAILSAAGVQTAASVTCPIGTVALGGGGIVGSSSTAANLNSSIPTSTGWRVDANNATASDTTVTAYIVCGKKPGKYLIVAGTTTLHNPSTQASSTATCPAGTVPFGGGHFSGSHSVKVNLNSTGPLGTGWRSYQNNGSDGPVGVSAYVVCGKAASAA